MAQEAEGLPALTFRAGGVALLLVLLWTLGASFIAINEHVYITQFLMIVGFGAILTIFLLQFPRLFVGAVILVFGGSWALSYSYATPEDYARLNHGLLVSIPVGLAALSLAVCLSRRPLRRTELAVIYAAVVIAIPWCICIKAVMESSTTNLFELQRRGEGQTYAWAKDLPWWGPTIATGPGQPPSEASLAAITGFTRGNGGQVPWNLWWRPILYWTGMCLAYEAMLMGLLLMLRRRWIEHERLPFVWSYPALQIIGPEDSYRPPRRHWIAFAIGLAICLPGITFVGPAGEALMGWTVPPWAGQEGWRGGFDLTGLNILPNVPLRLFWGPLILTVFLLFPLDVLLTVAVTYILTALVLPQILYSMGVGVGPARLADFVKWGLRFGGGLGILIWSLWFNRKTIAWFVRGLWGGRRSDEDGEPQTAELPRGLVAGVAVAGIAAFIALGCYVTTLVQMLFLTGFLLVYAFSQLRQRIEGIPFTTENNIASHQMTSIQRDVLGDHFNLRAPGDPITTSSWGTHWLQWGFVGQLKSFGPHNMLLEAFKVAHELKVNPRTIAVVILATMLIVAAILPSLYLKLMYIYGFDNSYSGDLSTWNSFTQWSERAASYGVHSTSQVFILSSDNWYDRYRNIINTLLGVSIIGVLFHLRREYPRFLVNPIGIVLAAEYFTNGGKWSADQVWFSFLIAGIFKALIFRWMGVRYFREKIQPIAIMLLCGMIFGMMLYLFRQASLGSGFLR